MDERPAPADTGGDYGYDLAHEVPPAVAREQQPDAPAHPPTYQVTTTDDTDGDYGYDLAHEVPPSTGR
jgi:hypothetical protein